MCTVLLPAGVNPIAFKKYIISYRIPVFFINGITGAYTGCSNNGFVDMPEKPTVQDKSNA
jgi:hypothetical protein